jgi:hypothetical protein
MVKGQSFWCKAEDPGPALGCFRASMKSMSGGSREPLRNQIAQVLVEPFSVKRDHSRAIVQEPAPPRN